MLTSKQQSEKVREVRLGPRAAANAWADNRKDRVGAKESLLVF